MERSVGDWKRGPCAGTGNFYVELSNLVSIDVAWRENENVRAPAQRERGRGGRGRTDIRDGASDHNVRLVVCVNMEFRVAAPERERERERERLNTFVACK